jgi:hypothetical protein
MDSTRFNEACRYLRSDRFVRVRLLMGRVLEGFPLSHTPAGGHSEGQLELETRTGIVSLLSSSIASIDLINNEMA